MVIVASDNAAFRRRWRARLADLPVRESRDRIALAASLAEEQPSVVLLDLALPGLRSVSRLSRLLRVSPSSRVIVFSPHPSEREALAVFAAGARGYAHRDLDPPLVRKAVEMVQKGEIWAGRSLIAWLVDELSARGRPGESPANDGIPLTRLTRRQREIAALVGEGFANKEIASHLRVTERTVKAHLTAIFRRLGVSDRLRLALLIKARGPRPPRGANGSGAWTSHGTGPRSNLRGDVAAR